MKPRLTWVGCGEPATVRIEAYSPAGRSQYGSLDASAYACGQHADSASDAIRANGMTPYRSGVLTHKGDRGCGYIFRYSTTPKDGAQ